MSSRLALDGKGRLIVVVTTSSDVGLTPGDRFIVIGNDFEIAGPGIRWLGTKTGRRWEPLEVAPLEHGRARLPDAAKREGEPSERVV